MRHRSRLALLAGLVLAAAGCRSAQPPVETSAEASAVSREFERLDPAFDALVPAGARVETLADGFDWSEGPAWRRSGGYLLFSDIPKNTIYRWQQGQGLSVFLRPAGYTGPTPPGRWRSSRPR